MNRTIRNFIARYQEIILPGIFFIFSATIVLFGILPATSKILELMDTVNKTRDSVNLLSAKEAFLGSQNEYSLQQKLQILVSAIPQDKSLPTVFSLIDGLSVSSGVTLINLTLSGGQLSTASAKLQTTQERMIGASILPFVISVSGSPSNLLSFIAKATQSRRLVRFQNFDVSLASTAAANLKANFQAFYTPLPQTQAVAEQALPILTTEDNATLDKLTSFAWLSQQLNIPNVTEHQAPKANPFSP